MPKRTAYFDTNVFQHVHNLSAGISREHVRRLTKALKRGKLTVLLSIISIEEAASIFSRDPERARAELGAMFEIADASRMLKAPNEILQEHTACYARGEPLTDYFDADRGRPYIPEMRRLLTAPTLDDALDLLGVLEKAYQQQLRFQAAMAGLQDTAVPALRGAGLMQVDFSTYRTAAVSKLAHDFAERAGLLEECEHKGMEGLLRVRCVALWAGYTASLMYAQHVEGRSPKPGDSRDTLHVVSAAAADVFVTHDKELTRLLARVQVPGFRVVDLPTLLDEVWPVRSSRRRT